MILSPYFWGGVALALLASFGAGYWDGQRDTVPVKEYTTVVTARVKLEREVKDANDRAAAERKRQEDMSRSASAAAGVAVAAAEARAANDKARADALMAQNAHLLAGINLPGFVRELANGVPARSEPITRPISQPSAESGPGAEPVTATAYVTWCTAKKTRLDAVADDYDTLYTYARSLYALCNKKGTP